MVMRFSVDFSSIVSTNPKQKAFPYSHSIPKHWTMPSSKAASKIMVTYSITTFALSRRSSDSTGIFLFILEYLGTAWVLGQLSLEMDVGLTMHNVMCDLPFRPNCRNVMFTHGKETMASLECAKQFVSMIPAIVSVFLSQPRRQASGRLSLLISLLSLEYSHPAN